MQSFEFSNISSMHWDFELKSPLVPFSIQLHFQNTNNSVKLEKNLLKHKNVSQSPCFLCCCHMCHRHPGATEFSSTFLKKQQQSTVVAFVVVEEEEAVSLLPWLVVARVKKPAIERRKLSKRRAFQISAFLRPPTIFSAHFPLVKARKTDTCHGDMVTLTEPFPFLTWSLLLLFCCNVQGHFEPTHPYFVSHLLHEKSRFEVALAKKRHRFTVLWNKKAATY